MKARELLGLFFFVHSIWYVYYSVLILLVHEWEETLKYQ
jgi:hypothetical protein